MTSSLMRPRWLYGFLWLAVCSWWTAPKFRALRWVPITALLVIWAATPTVFWPLIQELHWVKNGKHVLGPEAASAIAMKWIVLDWLRTAFIVSGFIASVRAIGTGAPAIAGPGANRRAIR